MNDAAIELITDALTAYASIYTMGQSSLIANGVSKTLLAAWSYLVKFEAAVQLIMTNDVVKNSIANVGINGNKEGQKFLKLYELKLQPFFNYVGKPAIEFLLTKDIPGLIENYTTLSNLWDLIKITDGVKNNLTTAQISEITTSLVNAKKKLNNEEIIE